MTTATCPIHTLVTSTPVRHCDICGGIANITVNRDHFCGDCMRAKRVRAFLIGSEGLAANETDLD